MTTTVYIDASGAVAADTPKFVRTIASETDDFVNTAARITKRVTADTTLANAHGGPGFMFQRGYGTTDANDTNFALLGASYEGVTSDHEFNFFTSTNGFSSSSDTLLTLSRKNADFNVPVGMNAYANATAINAIPNPTAGMVVYNTASGTLYVYNGTQWNDVAATAASYTLPAASTSALGGVIIPVVGTSGITNSSGTIGLATASTTQLGAVKVDGSTVTINGSGVISANTSYTLPTATTSVLGGVKIDGTTITIDGSGVISSTSATNLNALTDVTLTSVSANQLLGWDAVTSQWINKSTMSATTGTAALGFERQSNAAATGAQGLLSAIRVVRRITDATTGYDEGGGAILFQSVGTSNVFKNNALIGAYNNTGDVSDFAIQTSNDGGTSYGEALVTSRARTNINQGLLYADKTNNRVGINDTAPDYALDVNGQVRATSGFIGDLTGNADTVTNGVVTTGSYANPSWITSLAYSKLTGAPSLVTTLDGLSDVTISNAQKGKFLYYNGTAWVDSSNIEFDNIAYRGRFTNNSSPGTVGINSAAEFLKNTGDAPSQGDGTGILFGTVQTNGTKRLLSRLTTDYRTSEAHKVYIQSSNDDFNTNSTTIATFATDGTTISSTLTVTDDLIVNGNDLTSSQSTFNLLNSSTTNSTVNFAGFAPSVNIGSAAGTVTINGDLKVSGDTIKSSTADTITLDGANMALLGSLTHSINTFNRFDTDSVQTITSFGDTISRDKMITFISYPGSTGASLAGGTSTSPIRFKYIYNSSGGTASFSVSGANWPGSTGTGSVSLQARGSVLLLGAGTSWYAIATISATLS